jgi:AraC-like DNA-binding protein
VPFAPGPVIIEPAPRNLRDTEDNPIQLIPISAQYEKLNGAILQGLSRDTLLRESFIDPEHHGNVSFAQAGLLYVHTMIEMDDQFIGLGRRAIPTSQLAVLFRVMIGCGTLGSALSSLVQFHAFGQPVTIGIRTDELVAKLFVNCDDAFAGANAALIEDIYIQSIFGGLSYFLGRPLPATAVSTRNRNNPAIGVRHYSMLTPLRLDTVAAIQFPASMLSEHRQGEPTDDLYWKVCENWLGMATATCVRASCVSIRQLNTKALCTELRISPATFRRRNSVNGGSFRRFREETLVEASLALLTDDSRSISSIAAALGYADARSYRRFIKGATGLTPDQLRAKRDAATMRAFEPKVVARIKDLTTRLSR